MMDDDKALVERLAAAIKESIGKQFNATPIHPDPSVGDWAASGGVIDLKQVAQALLPIISGRIEALSEKLAESEALLELQNQDIGRLREALQLLHDNIVTAWPSLSELDPVVNARAALGEKS